MNACDYCDHVEMCSWRKDLNEHGCEFYADGNKWIPCTEPPKDERNVFLAHGTNDFKSCCIGHYDHSMKLWYEDKNWFASPIYDCKYWCEIPELPEMGDKQFEMPCRNEGERK